jgi:steroid 5-alpha reductase family enzyme
MTLEFMILSLAAITVALSVIMSGAWLIRERTGNSGWVDTTWTVGFSSPPPACLALPAAGNGVSAISG